MVNKKSKNSKAIIFASKKGYRVIDGKVYYNDDQVKANIKNNGYYAFSIRTEAGERFNVTVHRLVAYQKYGNKIFKKNIQVRHLDNDCLNNADKNIAIGTPSQNNLDKDPMVRLNTAINASSFTKKHNHAEIIKLYSEGFSYKQIMERLKIKSKGTISFIIKKSMESKI